MVSRSKRLALRQKKVQPNYILRRSNRLSPPPEKEEVNENPNITVRRSKRLAMLRKYDTLPDLPDDLIRQIFLRVPYQSHCNLKVVSRQWRDVVTTPAFYKERKTLETTGHLICINQHIAPNSSRIIVLDPVTRTWSMLRPIPDSPGGIPLYCNCLCVNQNIILIGGELHETREILRRVYIFYLVSAKWRQGADMPTSRYDYVCTVSSRTGLIYVAGGRDNRVNALLATEAYNVVQDTWEILPAMNQHIVNCCGLFIAEKLLVFNQNTAEVFDPNTDRVWRMVLNRVSTFVPWLTSFLVVSGQWYKLIGTYLTRYDAHRNEWIPHTELPPKFGLPCAAEWCGHIFFH